MIVHVSLRFADTKYEVDDIGSSEERGPFQNVLALECEQMNRLLLEVNRSLVELSLGFAGELTMSGVCVLSWHSCVWLIFPPCLCLQMRWTT